MRESSRSVIKSTQEQALASWIAYLNQCRFDVLIEKLNQQDINLEEALQELDELKKFIDNPSHILGNSTTKHGEIAEHMQVNIENARRAIRGMDKNHTFEGVGRLAKEDYMRDGHQVQSKFYNGLNNTIFGQHALAEHLETYPDFVRKGGVYDIPKDQYEKLVDILDKYQNHPSELSNTDYRLAKKISDFFEANSLELGKDINPTVVDYSDAQQANANRTVENEENSILETDKEQRNEAYEDSKPTMKEGLKATVISAAVEGGVSFCLSVARKRREKAFSEFTSDDWKEIGIETGTGTVKGGVRGGAIYVLTNFTATPANVASAYVTAYFGIASQIQALENGSVTKEDFIINCETICLDVAISSIASAIGELLIPISVLGAVIGNVVGTYMYQFCKNQGGEMTEEIIANYNLEMAKLNQILDLKLLQVMLDIEKNLEKFDDLVEQAFDEKVDVAFNGSINLAREVGVEESKILKTMSDIDHYFCD